MGTPMITLAMLKGACDEQRATFKKEWPQGAEATLENVRRAQKLGLDLEWGKKWFTPASLETYEAGVTSLWASYEAERAPLRETYEAGVAPLWLEGFLASRAEVAS